MNHATAVDEERSDVQQFSASLETSFDALFKTTSEFVPLLGLIIFVLFLSYGILWLGRSASPFSSTVKLGVFCVVGLLWGFLENRNETAVGGILPAVLLCVGVGVSAFYGGLEALKGIASHRNNQVGLVFGLIIFLLSARYFTILTN